MPERVHPPPCTLHATPYTLHPTPYTLHPTPYTLHLTPYTLQGGGEVTPTQREGWEEEEEEVRGEREFFIDNLLARIHLIIEKILVDRLCATGVEIPFSR